MITRGLTVRFPLDSSYLYGRVSTLNTKHLLSIQSVDLYLFVNSSQRNQIHSWAVCQVFRVDGWLHHFFGEWVSHLDQCVSWACVPLRMPPCDQRHMLDPPAEVGGSGACPQTSPLLCTLEAFTRQICYNDTWKTATSFLKCKGINL